MARFSASEESGMRVVAMHVKHPPTLYAPFTTDGSRLSLGFHNTPIHFGLVGVVFRIYYIERRSEIVLEHSLGAEYMADFVGVLVVFGNSAELETAYAQIIVVAFGARYARLRAVYGIHAAIT